MSAAPTRRRPDPIYSLGILGLACAAVYVAVTVLSRQFVYGEGYRDRPIFPVLGLFALAFVLYLVALRVAVRASPRRGLLAMIVGCAVAFRAILLFSTPIQDVGIYRYVWDGSVGAARVNPYRYSPQQVEIHKPDDPLPPDLSQLVNLRTEAPERHKALLRVPEPHLPSAYPPVSQAVFTLVAQLTPDGASLEMHILTMKLCFILFDLGTLLVLVGLLRWSDRPLGWALAYAWCPLVLKEVANSGHIDSLAVFLTMLAVALAARAYCPAPSRSFAEHVRVRSPALMLAASAVLALAVGAKLYPLVLAPLLLGTYARLAGLGRALLPILCFVGTTAAVCWPMLPSRPAPPSAKGKEPAPRVRVQDPSRGLQVFLREREGNDFLFRLIVENLQPVDPAATHARAWFAVLPASWRDELTELTMEVPGVERSWAPFLAARGLTGLVFVLICGWLAWRGARARAITTWFEAAFLTLAWFWLLAPTQFPWYWLWALPLIPFARGRAWLAVSGLVFVYYLRFWLYYHHDNTPVAGTPYAGSRFFDLVVVWAVYLPWLAWLVLDWLWRRPRKISFDSTPGAP
ncbi:MAG: hypothetical protein L0Z62_02430 [Gemmataceae bacterium]|nr:hypothetical protein [Gemmataceae bacterium]